MEASIAVDKRLFNMEEGLVESPIFMIGMPGSGTSTPIYCYLGENRDDESHIGSHLYT